jgi:4-amino-4-deoxy-L-arabinose transferase-like glycosyltransferase
MEKIASFLWALAAALGVAAAGLSGDIDGVLVAAAAVATAALVFSAINWGANPARRVYLETEMTGKFLDGLFEDRTSIQAQRAVAIYVGKWVRVSGVVNDVCPNFGLPGRRLMLDHTSSRDHPSVFATFIWSKEKLDVLHKGDIVEVEGRIREITPHWVSLSRCTLIGVKSPSG